MLRRALAALAILTLSACGEAAAPAPTADRTASATSAPVSTAAPATAAPAGPAIGARTFLDYVTSWKGAAYKVGYKMTVEGKTGTSTWYSRPPQYRYDFVGSDGTGSFFVLQSGSFVCLLDAARWSCYGAAELGKSLQEDAAAQIRDDLAKKADAWVSSSDGTRTIAGQRADCFSVKETSSAAQYRVCFSTQAVLLLVQTIAGGDDQSWEATSVGAVSDADFQLPAPPSTY